MVLFCCAVLSAVYSFAIDSQWKREKVALHKMPFNAMFSVSLPHDAMRWSTVCQCGISMLYLIIFFITDRPMLQPYYHIIIKTI